MLEEVINELGEKLNNTTQTFQKIQLINNTHGINSKQLKLLANISTNLHNLTDEIEELYLMYLDDNEILMSSEEKIKLRDIKINNKIKDMFYPMMILTRLLLENQR